MKTKRLQLSMSASQVGERPAKNSPRKSATMARANPSISEAARIQNVAVKPGKRARKVGPNLSGNQEGTPLRIFPRPVNPQTIRKSRLIASNEPIRARRGKVAFMGAGHIDE